jgi:hypothetical protein
MAFVERYREMLTKVHITRILGTNKAGDILPDIWADVERIEALTIATQYKWVRRLEVTLKFRWRDDPDDTETYRAEDDRSENEDLTAAETVTLKVCSPDEADLNDPEEWIPVRVLKRLRMLEGGEGGMTSKKFLTDQLTKDLGVRLRRFYHYDTSMDDRAKAAFDADPTRKAYVEKAHLYAKDDETKDDSQYVECEVFTQILKYENAHERSSGTDQKTYVKLKNQYLIDESEPAQLEELGTDDKNPPYRLDPFQNIINVQLASPEEAVLGTEPLPISYTDTVTETSEDGLEWEPGFDDATSNAATGLGRTVVCRGKQYIAFGKPRDGAKCFITAKDFTIQRGILNTEGTALRWTTVATLPEGGNPLFAGARSCSFAGGAFFVSYLDDDDRDVATHLAVSFDGETFQQGVQPFNGVIDAASGTGMAPGDNDPNPAGGNVAYDKKNDVYVTTGEYTRGYWNQQDIGAGETAPTQFFDRNFMSSVSTNGTSWTPKFDASECSGFPPTAGGGIGSGNGRTNVTFGNKRFVAATSFKLNYDFYSSPSFVVYKQTAYAAAIATSPDGKTWTNMRLPGSVSAGWVFGELVHAGGTGTCARFFKTKKNASGVPGFFVATALEYLNGETVRQGKLWQSEDGITWALVRTDSNKHHWILSTINKSRGTIVYRD